MNEQGFRVEIWLQLLVQGYYLSARLLCIYTVIMIYFSIKSSQKVAVAVHCFNLHLLAD